MDNDSSWIVVAWTHVGKNRQCLGLYTLTQALAVASYLTAQYDYDARVTAIDLSGSSDVLSKALAYGASRFSPSMERE